MKMPIAPLCALALTALLPAGSQALWGAREGKLAVLFVPREDFAAWEGLGRLLESHPRFKLTLAAPESVPAAASADLKRWIAEGRLEIALRVPGDPVLPLLQDLKSADVQFTGSAPDGVYPRSRDVIHRVALSKDGLRRAFGAAPLGLAPGGGALSLGVLDALKDLGLHWAATGDYGQAPRTFSEEAPEPTAVWWHRHGIAMVPFRTVASAEADPSPGDLPFGRGEQAVALLLDESDGLIPPGSSLRLLGRLLEEGAVPLEWATVSEVVSESGGIQMVEAPSDLKVPTWLGDYSAWIGSPAQNAAWGMLNRTARVLDRYQNSGTAVLDKLEKATGELYGAQASPVFRALGSRSPEAPELERKFRSRLIGVHRRIGEAPPEELHTPVLAPAGGEEAATGRPDTDGTEPEAQTSVRMRRGQGWISFENPPESAAEVPHPLPELPPSVTGYHLWELVSLRVDWDERDLRLSLRPRALDNGRSSPLGFSHLLADIYLDLNHRPRSGSTMLLPGRQAYVASRDGWEYALTLTGWGGALWRSSPEEGPVQVMTLAPQTDPETQEIRLSIPRARIPGDPARWGYLALALAVGPPAGQEVPFFKPLPGGKGSPILGLLGPLEAQRRIQMSSAEKYRRLQCVRFP